MAKAKWIFGQQSPSPRESAQPQPPPVSTADEKKFGLENFGNTCYANSVIQALYFCSPFRELLLQAIDTSLVLHQLDEPAALLSQSSLTPVRKKPERKPSTSGSTTDATPSNGSAPPTGPPIPPSPPTLFSALRSLFFHISAHPSEKGTVAPRAFIDKLKEVNEIFNNTMHQDAHEFLNYLLNKIVEEIDEERKRAHNATPPSEDLSNSITTLASKPPPTILSTTTSTSHSGTPPETATLVHKLFEGVLTSETRCLTCETVSSRDESFLDLSIDIEQNASVTACLRQFSASEMLCSKNKFFCDSCCDLQEAEKRMKIKKLPNVLALHLKRFKYQEESQKYIKLAYRVAFPFQLRLFNTVDETDEADRLYNLFGIVVHIGTGPHHGHYISIIKSNGSWQVFDDDNVYGIAEGDIPKYFGESNSGSAYVLYYQADDIDPVTLGIQPQTAMEPVDVAVDIPINLPQASPPQYNNPLVPPGLVEAGDSSDLSDPPFPITPSHSSQQLSTSDKPSHLLEVKALVEEPEPITLPPPPSFPTSPTKTKGGLFSSIRRTPSARLSTGNSAPEHRRSSATERPPSMAEEPKTVLASPPSPTPPKGKDHPKDPERKSTSWFTKRKSFRLGDKRSASETASDLPSSPGPPVVSVEDAQAPSLTASSSSWFKPPGSGSPSKVRRPSEPSLFEPPGVPALPTRPKSTAVDSNNLAVQTDHLNGYESPSPASASSSMKSGKASSSHRSSIPPPPAGVLATPPTRTSSLAPAHSESSHKGLELKKSLSSLTKKAASPITLPPRPASVAGQRVDPAKELPPPPVPPLPPSVLTDGRPSGEFVLVGKGKAPADEGYAESPLSVSPVSFPISDTNGSAVGSTPTNHKRPPRKISISGPFLGFGKKDKDKKDKENGKSPPISFGNFGLTSKPGS